MIWVLMFVIEIWHLVMWAIGCANGSQRNNSWKKDKVVSLDIAVLDTNSIN